ncbi:cytochrome b562 [Colwellia sp. MEBiC06753]
MKKVILTALVSCIAFSTPSFANHPMCGKTELADVMDNMKDQMKLIKGAVKSGDIAAVTAAATDLLAQVEKSDQYIPLSISDKKELNAEQQAQFNDYQQGISSLKDAVTELVAAQDLASAKMALGKIGKASKKGHKAFKMDCDD